MPELVSKIIDQALSYHRNGKINEASKLYLKALSIDDKHPMALHFLGVIHHQQGDNIEAERLIKQALKITPNDLMAMSNLGSIFQALGKLKDALDLFSKILAQQPNNAQIYTNRGNAFRASGQNLKAIKDYQAAIKLEPRIFEAARNLGIVLQEERQYTQAQQALEHCIKLAPNNPEARVSLANFYRETGQIQSAKIEYETALTLAPNIAGIHCDLAITLRDIGNLTDAKCHYETAVKIEPGLGRAWRGLAGITSYKKLSEISTMQEALSKAPNHNEKMHIEFALGKAQEDLKNYDAAFAHFKIANELHHRTFSYDFESDFTFFKNLISKIDSEFLKNQSSVKSSSNRPIFVIGMPRSGTSLVEQILASHSHIFGAGELTALPETIANVFSMTDDQDYSKSFKQTTPAQLQAVSKAYFELIKSRVPKNSHFFVDKMPMNFIHVGLISLTFPQALIIHCKRNPLDNCLSIFKNYLPASGHRYSANLESLGHYYRGYLQLMQHWKKTCGDAIFEVVYSDLVQNSEKVTRDLISACNLPFEEACLSPHKTQRVVSTLSATQVRQTIYSKSVGSAENYKAHLSPLNKILTKSY